MQFSRLLLTLTLLLVWTGPVVASPPAYPDEPFDTPFIPDPSVAVRLPAEAYRPLPGGLDNLAEGLNARWAIDYGSFAWLEIPDRQLPVLEAQGLPYQPAETTIGVQEFKFDPLRGEPSIPAALRAEPSEGDAGLHLVQFIAPLQDAWLADVAGVGLRPIQYYAHNAYLVWGTPDQVSDLAGASYLRWSGSFHPAYKLNPYLDRFQEGRIENVAVTFYNDGAVDRTLAALEQLGGEYVQHYPAQPDGAFYTVILALEAERLVEAARLPTVWALDYASPTPAFDDENGAQIIAGNYPGGTPVTGYYDWLVAKGVNGDGITWADVDTGLNANHPDITGRAVAFVSYTGAGSANVDSNGHGSHTAGAIFGDGRGGTGIADPNGFYWGTGAAPSATLVVQNALMGYYWPPSGGWQVLSRDSLVNGAMGSSNSWYTGASGSQGYSSAARTHDIMVRDGNWDTTSVAEPIVMVFSAGNSGDDCGSPPCYTSMTEPKEAKNLISVGASVNYPRIGSSVYDMAYFSSRGPAQDGRMMPTVTAPGYRTASFNGSGANCGSAVPGAGAAYYNYCSGTSMAAPFVSGAAALIADWWAQEGRGAPSPAMVKALLINGAADMVGGNDGGGSPMSNLPNWDQGWGLVNLDDVIRTGVPSRYFDQDTLFTATGQTWHQTLSAADPSEPVKISLVWSDAPGAVNANPALVNDLDLTVVHDGSTYRGNVFANGWSVPGGSADGLNNLENVYLQNPSGLFEITVSAANIAGDGVPYNGDATDQDFALVISNAQDPYGFLEGMVYDGTLGGGLADATVQAITTTTEFRTTTEASGYYTMPIVAGTYTVKAWKYGYTLATATGVSVESGLIATQGFTLAQTTPYSLTGCITDAVTSAPLAASISIVGPLGDPVAQVDAPQSTGCYSLTLYGGPYTITVESRLHDSATLGLDLMADTVQNFALAPTTTDGLVWGHVTNLMTTGSPVDGATVELTPGSFSGQSGPDGYYELQAPPGVYTATVSAPLYSTVVQTGVTVPQSNLAEYDFALPTAHLALFPPGGVSVTVEYGEQVTATLVISNSGLGGLDFVISEPGDGIPWLTASPIGGMVAGGTAHSVTLTFDGGTGAEPGAYHANLRVTTNDPAAQPYVDYPIAMTLLPPPPDLAIGKMAGTERVEVGTLLVYTIVVTNAGGPASDVVISDALPAGTQFAWASDDGEIVGADLVWSGLSILDDDVLAVGYGVTVTCVASGTSLVNAVYQVTAAEWPTPTAGRSVTVTAIQEGVVAEFAFPTPVVRDHPAAFHNLSQHGTGFAWAFGDGLTSTLASPTHVYDAAGVYTATLTARNLCTSDTAQHRLTVQNYAVAMGPPTAARSGDPGERVTYTLRVTNTGTLTDTFALGLGSHQWDTGLSDAAVGPLAAGESAAATVYVTVALDALASAQDGVTVVATSVGDPRAPQASASSGLTTQANVVYGAAVAPSDDWEEAVPGDAALYRLRIRNDGNISDTYSLALVRGEWPVEWSPTGDLALDAGASRLLDVQVAVPLTSTVGEWDVSEVLVTAASGVTATGRLTTAVGCEGVNQASFVYAPFSPLMGQAVTFTGTVRTGTPPITYTWDFGDGSPPVVQGGEGRAAPTVTHAYTASGVYRVVMTALNCSGAESDTSAHIVTVGDAPDILVHPTDLAVALGPGRVSTSALTIQNVGSAALAWAVTPSPAVTWLDAAPLSGSLAPAASAVVAITLTAPSTIAEPYTTTLWVTSDDPDAPEIPVPVMLTVIACQSIAGVDFSYQPTTPLVGQLLTFEGVVSPSTASPPIKYTWAFGDDSGAWTGNPITHTFPLTGQTYVVTLTAVNLCPSQGMVQKTVRIYSHGVYLPLVLRH